MSDPGAEVLGSLGPADGLTLAGAQQLRDLVGLVAADPTAPTTVRDPDDVWRVHVADSLSGLAVADLKTAARIGDIGAGAGFPGLVLAIMLPDSRIDLIESVGRKCGFMDRAIAALDLRNAFTVNNRAEILAASRPPTGGREIYDAITARAVSRTAALLELASPLLVEGGVIVSWKGQRDADEEGEAATTGAKVAMELVEILPVTPYPGSEHRHVHVWRKSGPTPAGLPRRPGAGQKRPIGL